MIFGSELKKSKAPKKRSAYREPVVDEEGYLIKQDTEHKYKANGHSSGLKEFWRYSSLIVLAIFCFWKGLYFPLIFIGILGGIYIFLKGYSERKRNLLEEADIEEFEDENDNDPYKDGFYGYYDKKITLGDDEEEYKRKD